MPLSRPYGVTRPVVGQMFHVKHSLWHRWSSGRRRPRLWGRAAVCAGGRRPAREPSAPRAFGSARRLEARPGPATAHRHHGQTQGVGRPRRVLCAASPVSTYGLHGLANNRGIFPWRCVGRASRGGVVPRAREGMQKVRSPCGSADLRGTPAVPEFAQWRSAFTRCLVSASSLS